MNLKNKLGRNMKMVLIITFLVFLTIIGLTYAYFLANISSNTQPDSVTVSAGKIELTYYDGNGEIVVDNLMPGEIIETKTFSVKNTGTDYISDYDIYLDTVVNDLEYKSDLKYTLTCKEYDEDDNYIDDCVGNSGTFPSVDTKLTTNAIDIKKIHKYELTVTYEETYEDQSEDMDKTVKGRIGVVDNSTIYVE